MPPSTHTPYQVDKFDQFLGGKLILSATAEDVWSFQLNMIEIRKIGFSFNQAVCGLRFFFSITFPKPWHVDMIPFGKRERKLLTVLGQGEVNRLLESTPNQKHRTFFMTLYSAGLRLSEAANLQLSDIDSQRMQLNIRSGKEAKQRMVPLSPRLLNELREYWKVYKPTSFLFPGKTPDRAYAQTSIQKVNQGFGSQGRIQEERHAAHAS